MKKITAVVGLVLALALAGCAPRADRASRTDPGTTQPGGATVQNQPAPAPSATTPPDTSSVNSDLNDVDKLLGGVDNDLSAAADSSHDAD